MEPMKLDRFWLHSSSLPTGWGQEFEGTEPLTYLTTAIISEFCLISHNGKQSRRVVDIFNSHHFNWGLSLIIKISAILENIIVKMVTTFANSHSQ